MQKEKAEAEAKSKIFYKKLRWGVGIVVGIGILIIGIKFYKKQA